MTLAPFISRDDLAAYTQRTFDVGDDALLGIALDSACDLVRSYTSQVINWVEDEEVYLDGSGGNAQLLPELPVISITEVIESDGNDTPLVAGEDFVLGEAGIMWRLPMPTFNSPGGLWLKGPRAVKVTYTHGYDITNDFPTTNAPPVPADLRLVALQVAARTFTGDAEVSSDIIPPGPPPIAGGLTEGDRYVLNRYRQRGVS